MKTVYTILISCFILSFAGISSAQIVSVPDPMLKAKLLSATTTNNVALDNLGNSMVIDSNSNGEIEVSEAFAVYGLNLTQGGIVNMTGIEAFVNLNMLNAMANSINIIDLSSNNNIENLMLSNNNIDEIDVSMLPNLKEFEIVDNNLMMLDVSGNPLLENLIFWENNLVYLNLKNGSSMDYLTENWTVNWMAMQDMCYICADDFEIADIYASLDISPDSPVDPHIADYCSFFPGGDFNTIQGTVRYDQNNDGVCSTTDPAHPYIRVNVNSGATFTDLGGEYIFITQEGSFNLVPEIDSPSYFIFDPASETVDFPVVDNSVEVVDFCIKPNGIHPDLEIVIAPILRARPGFPAKYKLVIKNKGNQNIITPNGIIFDYQDDYMDFTGASVTPVSTSTGQLIWDLTEIFPFEVRTIEIDMQVNAPTHGTFPVNIGDIFTFNAQVLPISSDETPADNEFVFNQTVVGSYDPNDITCIQGDEVTTEYVGEYLHYLIQFENTGTFEAENIVVVMPIDENQYDSGSLQILGASHDMDARIVDNIGEFFFKSIMLDSGGHGNILLKMKTEGSLGVGDSVASQVDIYFDYNYPVTTNEAVTIFELLSTEDISNSVDLKYYPNPTKDYLNIEAKSTINTIEIFDMSGRLIQKSIVNSTNSKQNVQRLSNGVYFMKIHTNKGTVSAKLIKQ